MACCGACAATWMSGPVTGPLAGSMRGDLATWMLGPVAGRLAARMRARLCRSSKRPRSLVVNAHPGSLSCLAGSTQPGSLLCSVPMVLQASREADGQPGVQCGVSGAGGPVGGVCGVVSADATSGMHKLRHSALMSSPRAAQIRGCCACLLPCPTIKHLPLFNPKRAACCPPANHATWCWLSQCTS